VPPHTDHGERGCERPRRYPEQWDGEEVALDLDKAGAPTDLRTRRLTRSDLTGEQPTASARIEATRAIRTRRP